MKILFVVHAYPPESRAGVETFTQMIAEHLSQDHEVQIFAIDLAASRKTRGQVNVVQRDGMTFHFFPTPTSVERKRKYKPVEDTYRKLLSESPFDIVHFQHMNRLPPALPRITKESGIPFVMSFHDFFYLCPTVNFFEENRRACSGPETNKCFQCIHGRNANPVLDYFEKKRLTQRLKTYQQAFQDAALLLAVSHTTKLIYEEHGAPKEKLAILPPALNLEPYTKQGSRGKIEPGGPLQVGFLGYANRLKGFHVLLESFKHTTQPMRLTAFGDVGPEFIAATALAIKETGLNYRHYGKYDRTELSGILAQVDVIVVPTLCYETYGLVIDEAFSAGIPVVASQIGGMQERIFEGRRGFLFPPGDSMSLAKILDRLAENYDAECQDMNFIGAVPDFKSNVDALLAHYQRILKQDSERTSDISSEGILSRKVLLDLLLRYPQIKTVLLWNQETLSLPIDHFQDEFQFSTLRDSSAPLEAEAGQEMAIIGKEDLASQDFDLLIADALLNLDKPLQRLDELSEALKKGSFLIVTKRFEEPLSPLLIQNTSVDDSELESALKNYGFRWLGTRLAPDRQYSIFQMGLQETAPKL